MLMANQADDCEGMAGEAREGEGGEEEDTTDDEFVEPVVSHELAEELQAQSDHEAEEILELLKDSPTEPDSHKPEPVQQKETQATAEASHAQQAASKAAASNESGEAPVAGGRLCHQLGWKFLIRMRKKIRSQREIRKMVRSM